MAFLLFADDVVLLALADCALVQNAAVCEAVGMRIPASIFELSHGETWPICA